MSNIDKQALRETAVLADRLKIDRLKICGSTVLALLDELEAAERRIAELDKRLIEYAGIATREARRVAELEAQAVSIPEVRITVAESKRKNLTWRELGAYNEGADVAKERISKELAAAGIGVKGE